MNKSDVMDEFTALGLRLATGCIGEFLQGIADDYEIPIKDLKDKFEIYMSGYGVIVPKIKSRVLPSFIKKKVEITGCRQILKAGKCIGDPCNGIIKHDNLCSRHFDIENPNISSGGCISILCSGKRIGLSCGKKIRNNNLCGIHLRSYKSTVKEPKEKIIPIIMPKLPNLVSDNLMNSFMNDLNDSDESKSEHSSLEEKQQDETDEYLSLEATIKPDEYSSIDMSYGDFELDV
jgi:hypothetical protein